MARYSTLGSGLYLTLLLLTGCSERGKAGFGVNDTEYVHAAAADACVIALTPPSGNEAVDQKITRFQQAVRHASNPVPHLERLGWAYVAKARVSFDPGFYLLGEQTALCIEARKPDSAEALMLRGHVLHNLHKFRMAETLAQELVARRGLWSDYGLLGDVLMEQGRLMEAVEAYQHMMDQRPGPQAYSRAAHLRWLKGDLDGAIELMRMVARTSSLRDRESAAWAHVRLATYELQAGQAERAAHRLSRALGWQADYPPALLWRGRLFLAQEKYSEAIPPLARAAELNPLPEYLWTLIEALRAAGRHDEANAFRAQLIQTGTVEDRRTFALFLATIRQDVHEAVRLAKEELKVRADVFTLDALAWAQHAAGRHDQASVVMERALSEGTQDARLFYHAGVIAAATDRYAEAEDWFGRAKAIEQMLLPSERENLAEEIAALAPHKPTLAVSP